MSRRFKTAFARGAWIALGAAVLLSACRTGPLRPGTPSQPGPATQQPAPPPGPFVPGHEGRPYTVVSSDSLLLILAFRGGALSKAGHNHVIAAHDLAGTVYVPDDPLRSSFELHFAVAELAVDEPELRSKEGPDFPADVPESAREGTRHNMLSEALLDAAQFPDITLVSERMEGAQGSASLGQNGAGTQVRAQVKITVRGQTHTLSVPLRYQIQPDRLTAEGEVPVKQSELGLKPFSAVMGALQVQDEMRIKFHIVAHIGPVRGAQPQGSY